MPEVREWSRARRGAWVGKLRGGNDRTLEPELALVFPDDASVNEALRVVAAAAKAVGKRRHRAA